MSLSKRTRRRAIRAALAAFLITGAGGSTSYAQAPVSTAGSSAAARTNAAVTPASSVVNFNVTQSAETLPMIVRSSRIITLDKPIPRFHVQNEQLLTATPISANQLQVSAIGPGITQLNMWDAEDNLFTVDVIISADAREVEAILATQFPGSHLKVTALSTGAGAVLSGTVSGVDDVDRAVQIVEQFYAEVVTNIRVIGVQQIMLHTKIMEVSRTKFRELGIDWGVLDRVNRTGAAFSPDGIGVAFPPGEFGGGGANALFSAEIGNMNLDIFIRALRQNNLIKVLAEPTVVATHGRASKFIVGGKVPYIMPQQNGAFAVQYEEFGTSVDFLPFVVGPGRIRLEVRPEVSEPDPARSLTVEGASIPAFRVRYVETAVEMNAGQTFAIAGLLQNRTEAVQRSTPFFGELPWIGSLFRRVAEENNEIELIIMVTPELAEAMDPEQVPPGGPGLNSQSPSDTEFFGRGYIEVPRTDDMCPAPSGLTQEALLQGSMQYNPQAGYGPPPGQAMLPFPDNPNSKGIFYPSGQPQQVAPGVMIMQPEN